MSYIPPPKTLKGFPKARKVKSKSNRKRWVDQDTGDILEWDYQHGRVEKYDSKGKHLGEFDPDDGSETKPAKPGRTITPSIIKSRSKRMRIVYSLAWYEKDGDKYIDEVGLPDVGEDDVRHHFSLNKDDPPGDCLEVTKEQLEWLKSSGVSIDLDTYAYFVEASQA